MCEKAQVCHTVCPPLHATFTLPACKLLAYSVRCSLRMISCLQLAGPYHLPTPLGFLLAPVFASLSYLNLYLLQNLKCVFKLLLCCLFPLSAMNPLKVRILSNNSQFLVPNLRYIEFLIKFMYFTESWLFKKTFYWRIVALQCCVSFYCTAK